MGKAKRQKHDNKRNSRKPYTKNAPEKKGVKLANKPAPHQQKQHQEPTIPFTPYDRILLIGEGDFSFSASLLTNHGCADVTATCYDSEADLLEKYPQASEHISTLLEEEQHVLYNVDATKLSQKEIRKGDKWDRIIFNFPHVGGKSTDVNRQVRYNQELLVSFFRAASPLLSYEGTIMVTLFEGEPYTLWNIRDLARHVGLKVGQSFKFQAEAYPGYKHARTLGNITGGGGWKGEERSARTYVFEKGDDEAEKNGDGKGGKKKKKDESEDDDNDDD